MARVEEIRNSRIIPADGREQRGRVSNPPDAPSATQEFKIPDGERTTRSWWDYNREPQPTQSIAVTMPLTPAFETSSIGGRRILGGGISREALRRARRNLRHPGRH